MNSLYTLIAIFGVNLALATDFGLSRTLHLKPRAEIGSEQICLNDLVEEGWLASRCAVENLKCCRWKINEGLKGELSKATIQKDLTDFTLGGLSISLEGADVVIVEQTKRQLRTEEIIQKIKHAIAERWNGQASNIRVELKKQSVPVFIELAGETRWSVELPEKLDAGFYAKIKQDALEGSEVAKVIGWVDVRTIIEVPAYVAKKTIPSNSQLRIDDFELRQVNVLGINADPKQLFLKGAFPEGMKSKQTVMTGKPLLSQAIERIPLVKLGDMVTLVLRSDDLHISTKGIVQGTAAIGEMVTVQLSKYNRTFRGKLLDGKVVEVWF